MRYRILSSDPHRLVLRFSAPERPLIIASLSLASFVCLMVGLAYALAPESKDDSLRALSFLGSGLFCLSAIFLYAGASAHAFPSRMIFDNDRGRLELQGPSGTSIGVVPYAGIAGLTVRRIVDDRVSRHSLGIDLERGGRWDLYASQRRSAVEAFQGAVTGAVTLGGERGAEGQPSPADRLPVDRSVAGVLRVAWKRSSHPVQLILSLVVLLSFAGALAGTRPFGGAPGGSIAAAAFGAFFLLAAAVSLLRTIGERMEVRIGRGTLVYGQRSALSRPRGFSLALSQIASVDFSMGFSRIATRIVVLQPREVDRFVRYRQGTFGPAEVVGMAGFLRGLSRIDVSALPLDQRLALAELLREAVHSTT